MPTLLLTIIINGQSLTEVSSLNVLLADPVRVRVAVRLRPKNSEDLISDADFADCVELQPEVTCSFHNLCRFPMIMKITMFDSK